MDAKDRPFATAAGVHLAAAIGIFITVMLARTIPFAAPIWAWAVLWGIYACVISAFAGLRRWWLPIQALAPVSLWLFLQLDLPTWVFPLAFLLLLSVYWNAFGEGVPLYLSNRTTAEALSGILASRQAASFIDLGSGLAGPLLYLAGKHPDTAFKGVETAPMSYLLSKLRRMAFRGENLDLNYRSIWQEDLSAHDVVYCFLSPVPMPKLYDKARAEMAKGSLLISNSFEVPGHAPDRIVQLADRRQTKLLMWEMPGPVESPEETSAASA